MELRPEWVMPEPGQTIITWIFGGLFGASLLYMAIECVRKKTAFPLWFFLGCGLTVFYEPINNVLGHCAYPEIGQNVWIEVFERKIPLYIGFTYFFYFFGTTYFIMSRLHQGVTAAQWWKYYAIGVLAATAFELIPINNELWKYYGSNQALVVLGFPAWWWFVNPESVMTAGLIFHLLRKYVLPPIADPVFVLLMPVTIFMTQGGPGMPVFVSLNATESLWVNTLTALASILLAVFMLWAGIRFVHAVDRPIP